MSIWNNETCQQCGKVFAAKTGKVTQCPNGCNFKVYK